MSLINKVLRDLDARSTTRGDEAVLSKSVYRGLRLSSNQRGKKRRGWVTGISLFIVALFASYYAANNWGGRFVASLGPDGTDAPVSVKQLNPPKDPAVDLVATAKPVPAASEQPKKKAAPAVVKTPLSVSTNKPRARVKRAQSAKPQIKKKIRPLTPTQQANNAYLAGARAMEQGRRGVAERELRTALAKNPVYVKARELLAGLMLSEGRSADAARVLEKGLAITPANTSLAKLLARIYVDLGQEAKGLAALESARKKASRDPTLISFLAAMYQRAGRHPEAVTAYRQALILQPREGRWWIGLGISLEAEQDWTAATGAYQKAINNSLDQKLVQYAQQRLAVVKTK